MPVSYVNVPHCERIVANRTRIRVRNRTISARLPLEPFRDIAGYFDAKDRWPSTPDSLMVSNTQSARGLSRSARRY